MVIVHNRGSKGHVRAIDCPVRPSDLHRCGVHEQMPIVEVKRVVTKDVNS